MSEKPGRGYLPPTVPTPGVRHQWPPTQSIYNSAPHAWQPPPNKPYLTALSGSASPQSEGLDLTSTASVGESPTTPAVAAAPSATGVVSTTVAHNGDDQVVNGQVIKTATSESLSETDQNASQLKVSVIAPNNRLSDEPKKKIDDSTDANVENRTTDVTSEKLVNKAMSLPDEIVHNLSNKNVGSPSSTPSTDQTSTNSSILSDVKNVSSLSTLPQPVEPSDSKLAGSGESTTVEKSSTVEKDDKLKVQTPSGPPADLNLSTAGSDHVESLLEDMFEANSAGETKEATNSVKEESVSSAPSLNKLSVIVTNVKSSALSEDKVVAMLEDTPLEEKPEVKVEPDCSVKKVDKKPDIMEVESELEKMFAGIVEPGSNESSKQGGEPSTDGQAKINWNKRRRVSRGKGRKSTDSSDHPVASPSGVKRGRKSKQLPPEDKVKPGGKAPKVKEERRGPYVRVVGPRDEPLRVTVVNSGSRLDDSDDRGDRRAGGDKNALRRKRLTLVEGRIQAGSGLYSSTLSAKYNSHSADTTWVCVFCKLGPHTEKGLGGDPAGDLFGPYIVHVSTNSTDPRAPSDKDVSAEQKRRGGGKQLSLRAAGVADQFIKDMNKKSRKPSTTEEQPPEKSTGSTNGEQEIWVHEKCAIWAPGVLLVNFHLIGLADAISVATVTKCSHCGFFGASVGCAMRNCSGRCHYGCAVASSWYLDVSKFIAACSNHAKQVSSS